MWRKMQGQKSRHNCLKYYMPISTKKKEIIASGHKILRMELTKVDLAWRYAQTQVGELTLHLQAREENKKGRKRGRRGKVAEVLAWSMRAALGQLRYGADAAVG